MSDEEEDHVHASAVLRQFVSHAHRYGEFNPIFNYNAAGLVLFVIYSRYQQPRNLAQGSRELRG